MADSVIKYSDLIGEDDTFDVIFDNIDKLRKELSDLAKDAKKGLELVNPNDEKALKAAVEQVEKLAKAKKKLDTEEKKAVKTKKKLAELTNKDLIQREKLKIANRERIQRLKQVAILTNKESGEIEKLRARLSLTTLAWKKLSKEELDNTKKGKNLIATKKKLTDQLKKLEKQTGDTRRNVGNYTTSLGKLGKVAAGIFVGRNIVSGLRSIGMGLGNLIEKNKDTNESAKSMSESMGKVGIILEKIGLVIINVIAKPLALIITGFEKFASSVLGLDVGTKKASEGVRDLKNEFNSEIEVLKKGNISTEARKQLIEDINKKYKDYLPNLLTEKSSLEEIEKAQNDANTAFEKKILLLASEEQFIDITKRKLDALRAEAQLQKELAKGEAAKAKALKKNKTSVKSGVNIAFGAAKTAIKQTKLRIKTNKQLIKQINAEKKALDAVIKAQGINTANFVSNQKKKTKAVATAAKVFKDNAAQRIAAIEALQDKIAKSEADNIEDQTNRLLALEQLKFETIEKQRKSDFEKFKSLLKQQEDNVIAFYGKKSQELIDFKKGAGEEILQFEADTQALSELQLQESEDRKLKIREDFEKKQAALLEKGIKEETEITDKEIEEQDKKEFAAFEAKLKKKLGLLTEEEKKERDFNRRLTDLRIQNIQNDADREVAAQKEKFNRMREDVKADEKITIAQKKKLLAEIEKLEKQSAKKTKKEKTKEKTNELLEGIQKTSEKIGAAIVATFEKQADAAGDLVKTQSDAVETQRKRAEQGLSNTLKFEQEQLAQREAERIRAEKKAKQAAEFVALINLVSAYAASGDSQALSRGLVDFSLLKALEAGFEDGGYTGDKGTSDVAGVVHGREFVVTADDVKRFGLAGKSGGDFGEAMSDYFYSPLQQNLYNGQADNFQKEINGRPNDFARLEDEMRAMRRAFQSVPKNDFDILQMTDYFVDIAKRVTSNRMTNVSKQRKRL